MSQELTFILKKLAAELKTDELLVPSMPHLVSVLSKQIGNNSISVKELAGLICSDTGITSQIIRTAQTMRYSNPGTTVTSIPNAISRIGISSTINLALALALEQNFNFQIPIIHGLCNKIIHRSNEIALYALGVCTVKYGRIPPLIFDYIILASSLLNIGYLPFLYELENYLTEKDCKNQFSFTEETLLERCQDIQYPLAIAILRHWKFDESFETAIKLEEDKTCEFFVNSLTYGNMYREYTHAQSTDINVLDSLTDVISHKFTEEELNAIKEWMAIQ